MGSMRKLMSGVVALLSAVVLSSCAIVPFGHGGGVFGSDFGKADARMEQIGAALNDHDAAALKAIFSKRALERATDIDARLDQLVSLFPNGGVTWERGEVDSEGGISDGKTAQLVTASYTLSAAGKDYRLVFADFTVNYITPDNTGIYGLGIIPWTEENHSGPAEPFYFWVGSIVWDESDPDGYPGVYAGYDNGDLTLHKVTEIVGKVEIQDHLGLRELFTKQAQSDYTTEVDDGIDKLYALFPDGEITWQEQQKVVPVVRETTGDAGGKTRLLLSAYRVSSATADYRLSFAYFTENTADTSNLGIYAIGIAPWTDSGDSAAEKAMSSWIDTFDVDASVPPGIFVAK
jgi:hypothetical protein